MNKGSFLRPYVAIANWPNGFVSKNLGAHLGEYMIESNSGEGVDPLKAQIAQAVCDVLCGKTVSSDINIEDMANFVDSFGFTAYGLNNLFGSKTLHGRGDIIRSFQGKINDIKNGTIVGLKARLLTNYVNMKLQNGGISLVDTIYVELGKCFVLPISGYYVVVNSVTNKVKYCVETKDSGILPVGEDLVLKIKKPSYKKTVNGGYYKDEEGYFSLKKGEFIGGQFASVREIFEIRGMQLFWAVKDGVQHYINAITGDIVLQDRENLGSLFELPNRKIVMRKGSKVVDFDTGEVFAEKYMYPEKDNERNIGFFSPIISGLDGSYMIYGVRYIGTNPNHFDTGYVDLATEQFVGGNYMAGDGESTQFGPSDVIIDTLPGEKCFKARSKDKKRKYLLVDLRTGRIIENSYFPIDVVEIDGKKVLKTIKSGNFGKQIPVEKDFDEMLEKFYGKVA